MSISDDLDRRDEELLARPTSRLNMVGKPEDYGMFTATGAHVVDLAVNALIARIRASELGASADKVQPLIENIYKAVDKAGHHEVYDTAVREVIVGTIEEETGLSLSIF